MIWIHGVPPVCGGATIGCGATGAGCSGMFVATGIAVGSGVLNGIGVPPTDVVILTKLLLRLTSFTRFCGSTCAVFDTMVPFPACTWTVNVKVTLWPGESAATGQVICAPAEFPVVLQPTGAALSTVPLGTV